MLILAVKKNKIKKKSAFGRPQGTVISCFCCSQSYSLISLKMCHLVEVQGRSKALSNSLDRDNCLSSWERAHWGQGCIRFTVMLNIYCRQRVWSLNCSLVMERRCLWPFQDYPSQHCKSTTTKGWVVGRQTDCIQDKLGSLGLFDIMSPAQSFIFMRQLKARSLNSPVLDIADLWERSWKSHTFLTL